MGVLADRLADLIEQMKESDRRFQETTEELLADTKRHLDNLDRLSKEE